MRQSKAKRLEALADRYRDIYQPEVVEGGGVISRVEELPTTSLRLLKRWI